MFYNIPDDNEKSIKTRKILFFLILAAAFVTIFVFNYLTPMLSDDYSYGAQVRQADGLLGLFRQEYKQYMNWNGRSIPHIILRIFLSMPRIVFKVANSIAFVILLVCVYLHVGRRKSWNISTLLLSLLGLWFFTVDFRQTILWETGACNYLWGTTIIFSFLTYARIEYDHFKLGIQTPKLRCVLLLLFGIIAGWCNENTSGGALLMILLMIGSSWLVTKKFSPGLISATIGNAIGLAIMVLAPGNKVRAAFRTELHTGLLGMITRFQKVTLTVRSYFFVLIAVFMATLIIIILQNRNESKKELIEAIELPCFFAILFTATAYALIMTSETQPRAFFGAGIFLLIGVIQGLTECVKYEREKGTGILFHAVYYTIICVFSFHFIVTYLDAGASNARIYRDIQERDAWVEKSKSEGEMDVTIAQVHTSFYNDFNAINEMELNEDPDFWTNVGYCEYFEIDSVSALPYDEWAFMNGLETEEEVESSRIIMEEQKDKEVIKHIPGFK